MKKYDYSILSKYKNELMGISIILIIIFHFFDINVNCANMLICKLWSGVISSIGVDIFLILSGIGIYYSFSKIII